MKNSTMRQDPTPTNSKKSNAQRQQKRAFVIFFAVVFLAIGIGAGVLFLDKSKNSAVTTKQDVHFYMKNNENGFSFFNAELHAIIDGEDLQVDINSNPDETLCLSLVDTIDVDGDGTQEAIIRNIQACGGNAIGDCFFIVKHNVDGSFSISENMGSDASDIEIETWNGQPSFVITNCMDDLSIAKLRYIYENGQIKLVQTISVEDA